ncbi:MAG: hypothetical protein IJ946_00845 [Clostridia bacterium]|nr:hypothetical protein [Clostridia bacterium]
MPRYIERLVAKIEKAPKKEFEKALLKVVGEKIPDMAFAVWRSETLREDSFSLWRMSIRPFVNDESPENSIECFKKVIKELHKEIPTLTGNFAYAAKNHTDQSVTGLLCFISEAGVECAEIYGAKSEVTCEDCGTDFSFWSDTAFSGGRVVFCPNCKREVPIKSFILSDGFYGCYKM